MSSNNSSSNKNKTVLQLGDIIQPNAPLDDALNGQQLYIKYIDDTIIELLTIDGNEVVLDLGSNGNFLNENIESVELLSRDENPGYAAQNGLEAGVWADFHFGGDEPMVITGKIMNVTNDQIEIMPLHDTEPIYIDFAYKGLPKDLNLEKISTRDVPKSIKDKTDEKDEKDESDEKMKDESMKKMNPMKKMKKTIQS